MSGFATGQHPLFLGAATVAKSFAVACYSEKRRYF
jgi:hypothetical protein